MQQCHLYCQPHQLCLSQKNLVLDCRLECQLTSLNLWIFTLSEPLLQLRSILWKRRLLKFEKTKNKTKQAWRTITLLKWKTRVLSQDIPDLRMMGKRVESTDSCRTFHPRYFQCPKRKYTPNFGHPTVVSSVSPLYLKKALFLKIPLRTDFEILDSWRASKKAKSNSISYFPQHGFQAQVTSMQIIRGERGG